MTEFETCIHCGEAVQRTPHQWNPDDEPDIMWWHYPTLLFRCRGRSPEEPIRYATVGVWHEDPLLREVLR